MRHLKAGRRLGRNAAHRRAMFRNLALALFRHERIITTEAKAKEVRPFVEKLITLAKKGTLHARRLAASRLGATAEAEVKPPNPNKKDDTPDSRSILRKLFAEIADRFRDRPGGYTRIVKRPERRLGDAGKTAYLELVRAGETRKREKAAAPAPIVTPPAPAAPKPEAPRVETPKPPETPPETPPAAPPAAPPATT